MRWLDRWRLRLRSLFRRELVDEELDTELQFHLDHLTQEHLAAGMSGQDARRAALQSIGGLDQVREACRDKRRVRGLEAWLQDIRVSVRSLRRSPLFTVTSVVLVAVSIGLACSAFAVVDAVLLRKLPVLDPDRLVHVRGVNSPADTEGPSRAVFEVLARERNDISHFLGFRSYGGLPATIGTNMHLVRVIAVAGDYFTGLGNVPVMLGGVFDPSKQEAVALISHPMWQRAFGGDPAVVGQRLTLGTVTISVVGVARPDFMGTQPDLQWDLLVPVEVVGQARGLSPEAMQVEMLEAAARLRPGVSPAAYEAHLRTIWPAILESTLPPKRTLEEWRTHRGTDIQAPVFSKGLVFALRNYPRLSQALTLTFGLSVLVFLASCLTLALLVVARGVKNQRRTAIMLTLGGHRWRVLRPYVVECVLIAALGCGGGLLVTHWGADLGQSFLPGDWRVGFSPGVIALALAMAASTAVLGTALAAFLSSRGSLRDVLQYGTPIAQPHTRLRTVLLALQCAVSVVLVHSALLYVKDLTDLSRADVGFDTTNLQNYTLYGRLPFRSVGRDYFESLTAEVQGLPGVDAVGLGPTPLLNSSRDPAQPVRTDDGRETNATLLYLFPGAPEAWGLTQLSGRRLNWNDQQAVVVTARLARSLYPEGSALGHRLRIGNSTYQEDGLEIVGVVSDLTFWGPRFGMSSLIMASSLGRGPSPSNSYTVLHVRSRRSLADLGTEISRVVERRGAHFVVSMTHQREVVSSAVQQERTLALVSSTFGALILLLVGVGLSAFCSYMLALRHRELAVRAALGASPSGVVAALLRETLGVLVVGSVVGLVVTFGLQRGLARLMGNFVADDLGALLWTLLIVTAVILSASCPPTLRAIHMNLARALRID